MTRSVLLLAHTGRPATVETARAVIARLTGAGLGVRVIASEAGDLAAGAEGVVVTDEPDCLY